MQSPAKPTTPPPLDHQRPPILPDRGEYYRSGGKLILVTVIGIALALLVLLHVNGINGTIGFIWIYRRIASTRIYPAMLLAAAPLFASMLIVSRSRTAHVGKQLACMMVSTFAMELVAVGIVSVPYDLNRIVKIVQDPITTSYFTDAELVAQQPELKPWLANYDKLTPFFTLHSKEKPPGPVLYYVLFLRLIGVHEPGFAALVGGLFIGILATLSIPVTYWFVHLASGDKVAGLCAATCMALSPSLVGFFPMFDQIYPTVTCLMLGFWIIAMRDDRHWASAAFGAVLALVLLFSYVPLVLGAFVVIFSIVHIVHHGRPALLRFLVHSTIALGTVILAYVALWLFTGFNPIATFRVALENQQKLLANLLFPRPYPMGIPSDFQDFSLGAAWITLPIIAFWFLRQRGNDADKDQPEPREIAYVGLAQILIVGVTGLLPGETARVWMFLQPLALVPAGLELSRWRAWHRLSFFALLWFLTTAIIQNMVFVSITGK